MPLVQHLLDSDVVCLFQEWYDERLQWDRTRIPLFDVVVEARYLWRPEFASINGYTWL